MQRRRRAGCPCQPDLWKLASQLEEVPPFASSGALRSLAGGRPEVCLRPRPQGVARAASIWTSSLVPALPAKELLGAPRARFAIGPFWRQLRKLQELAPIL